MCKIFIYFCLNENSRCTHVQCDCNSLEKNSKFNKQIRFNDIVNQIKKLQSQNKKRNEQQINWKLVTQLVCVWVSLCASYFVHVVTSLLCKCVNVFFCFLLFFDNLFTFERIYLFILFFTFQPGNFLKFYNFDMLMLWGKKEWWKRAQFAKNSVILIFARFCFH